MQARGVTVLAGPQVKEVVRIVAAATDVDGVAPLDEEGMLGLRSPRSGRTHVLADRDGMVVGYAYRTMAEPEAESAGAVVVHPEYRRHGFGRRLVRALLDLDPVPLRVWAHGSHPGASPLARRLGFIPVRELWQLQASLRRPFPEVAVPADVTIRTFRPGVDEEAWLELNAAAFAAHPEQGRWTRADLQQRLTQPWFDPSGFFLAESAGKLVGFHWTKTYPGGDEGEIYILGAHPDWHGAGLGKALAVTGLVYLRDLGLSKASLFVEADSTPAVRLYQKLGFERIRSDLMYRHPGTGIPRITP